MKAVIYRRYGPGSVELQEIPQPTLGAGEVLVRVRASSVNPVDWYGVYAPPFVRVLSRQLLRPKDPSLGFDLAGTVESVSEGVNAPRPGDDVFGSANGSWAEYAATPATRLARIPAGISFEEAAGVPVAGLTALQALRDHAAVEPGERVLINGASGGVGTYAIQIAKALGAEVTAVCSTGNVELARSLGADHVVDYTREDFTLLSEPHDVMIDIAGSRSFLRFRRVLTPDATVVVVGAKMSWSLLGPLKHMVGTSIQAIGRSQGVKVFMAKVETPDLSRVAELMQAGKVRTVIDRSYPLSEAVEALRYLGQRHAKGKIILSV
jgi:NADPH:quinone reductase-like Zn-dependent oxidoreductase